jgi:hypothetical protein
VSPKEKMRRRAEQRAEREPGLAYSLGICMLVGMEEIAQSERFQGGELCNTYHTHFPMPDGVEWELELRKKGA